MLPTTGFFKNIDCPFYENSCDRPYCHFRHRKKNRQDSAEVSVSSSLSTEFPTYNPTPKSQLANSKSHIPITYVPDLGVRRSDNRNHFRTSTSSSLFRYDSKQQPTYNPTPLSLLPTKALNDTKSSEDKTEVEKYNPAQYQDDSDDINFDNLESEFNMIDELISDTGTLDTTVEDDESTEDEKKLEQDNTKQNGVEKDTKANVATTDSKSSSHSTKKAKKRSSRETDKKSQKDESKSKEKRDDRHKDKKHKSSKHSNSESDRHTHKSQTKHHDDKKHSNNKHKHDNEKKRTSKDKKHKEKDREKDKSKKEVASSEKTKERVVLHNVNDDDYEDCDIADSYNDTEYNVSEEDSDVEDDPIKECLKIFTEYKPTEPSIFSDTPHQSSSSTNIQEEAYVPVNTKKRIAHESADKSKSKIAFNKPKTPLNPAQAMVNRMKAARLTQANDEHKNIFAEMERLKRSAAETSSSHSNPKKILKLSVPKQIAQPSTSFSLVDDIISGKSSSKPRRIAPVQNVSSIQRAKAKIEELARAKAINAMNKTAPQTISKGSKRVAHVPEFSVADIPDVLGIERSKLPVNVRSRYLKMLVDECLNLYLSKEDAYQRALNEEYKCYERCSVLTTYRNTIMLAINRLRKELHEREIAGLGPIFPGEMPNSDKKGEGELKGRKFCENVKRFILSEEELVLHGFPREGTTPGHAVIKVTNKIPKINFEGNDRICARCSKHYKVDRNGFALYEEECLYHPLKKRTFRGESIYLCCKSGEGTGCVTSSTHVCERINLNDEVDGYQTTMPPENDHDPRSYEVFALDCEMCYTTKGLELTRVTIVNAECKTVYESLVKPLNPIIDYNTRFSGITKEQMERTATSILQVQANILHLCNSNTILVGHSLESDMKALKIIHSSIIDTSVLFPHKFGLPHKRALRDLAREYLKKIIQNDINGHDSAEDALTCMELIQWKLKEDFKARGIKV